MEQQPREPNYDNVSFIDEHPELVKKVWLRRLARDRQLGRSGLSHLTEIIPFPEPDDSA